MQLRHIESKLLENVCSEVSSASLHLFTWTKIVSLHLNLQTVETKDQAAETSSDEKT